MIKIAHRKDEVRHSKDDKLELHEIRALMDNLKDKNKFIFISLLYGGLRVGELVHMRADWIHIDDDYSKSQGYDYIQIPWQGQVCHCDSCMLNAFTKVVRDEKKKPKDWYRNVNKEFHRLKKIGKLPIESGIWKPKSKKSARKIPILTNDFKETLIYFYSHNENLGLSRQHVAEIIKRQSKKILGRHLYPHAIRATTASLWVDAGLSVSSLMKTMGWETMTTAQIYIDASDKSAIKEAQSKVSVFEELIK